MMMSHEKQSNPQQEKREEGASPSEEEDVQMKRCILSQEDQTKFEQSVAYKDLVKFIGLINDSVKMRGCSETMPVSPPAQEIIRNLDQLHDWVDEIKPVEQPMRFGNTAFRSWHSRLTEKAVTLVENILNSPPHQVDNWKDVPLQTEKSEQICKKCKSFAEDKAIKDHVIQLSKNACDEDTLCAELCAYLSDSFGNATRIDYGTGHETNFFIFLLGLYRVGLLGPDDLSAIGLKVFPRYLRTVRRLQVDYMLEPAGSHGVWSLDDYQMLVFLFGSSQLIGHDSLQPSSIHSEHERENLKDEYLYFGAISFIHRVKHGGPFAEHSPILNDISGLPTWSKVNVGMQRMYQTEVLGKKPITQHILFGKLFPHDWEPSTTASEYYGSSFTQSTNPGGYASMGSSTVAPWAQGAAPHPRGEVLPRGGVSAVAPWASPLEGTQPIDVAKEAMRTHRSRSQSSNDK